MSHPYQNKQIGDVLYLLEALPFYEPRIEVGAYVILSIGDTCSLARVSERADGSLCATSTLVDVEMADLCWFVKMWLRVDPLG